MNIKEAQTRLRASRDLAVEERRVQTIFNGSINVKVEPQIGDTGTVVRVCYRVNGRQRSRNAAALAMVDASNATAANDPQFKVAA